MTISIYIKNAAKLKREYGEDEVKLGLLLKISEDIESLQNELISIDHKLDTKNPINNKPNLTERW